jgi:hypothetical protein
MSKRKRKSTIAQCTLCGKRWLRSFLVNKKAVSVVVSTIVLTVGVLGLGIAILYWTYSWGNIATRQLTTTEGNNAKALQEKLGFEYIGYSRSTNTLTVNIINWGDSNNVTVTNFYIYNSAHQYLGNYSRPALRDISTNGLIAFGLTMGGEGYFQIAPAPALAPGTFYYIRIVTDRGRTFDSSFATP